jgi:ubiquitin-protein ligase E3 C
MSCFKGVSTISARSVAILKYIPFAVPFLHRVEMFQKIIEADRGQYQSAEQRVLTSHSLNITVNRKYLYQDAFDQLSQDRTDDIKKLIRVTMVNAQGLEEAGIDGGGVFREFMSQLVKTGFDPSYGFFKTTSQQLLYPNPDIGLVHHDYVKHLHFLGRMMGKIIYEAMMVELPLAEFFLCKLLNRYGSDVDIYHLESLDPELYKNLLYLKNYDGDADDLSLNFTIMNDDYGETKLEELKSGGRDICVTNSNKIEYIHLVADYRLNKQIRSHVSAFRAGLSDVINIEWLQMFDHRELQILISGAPVPIDMDELRTQTNYSGDFSAEDEYIEEFWNIVSHFTEKQKSQFLKFVTSCSRPPLLGFAELYPKFCIHSGGESDERLPTASTCMNFLKLPRYKSTATLRNKLVYAIEAEAGFELS